MKTLAWTGLLTAAAATVAALTPVQHCGTVLRPADTPAATCDAPLDTRWDATWTLGLTSAVLLGARQAINLRRT